MAESKLVVLVHGWSVRSTDTYGELPDRLQAEARANGLDLDIRNIWLGRYVSFHDEVRLEDVSRAFDAALNRELGVELRKGRRFIAITHSTGGPVVRDWWDRFYLQTHNAGACPLTHLIMLAPANFGSSLAQLGKSVVGRLKSWGEGVEPGQGVLDWLELGSPESFALNQRWIESTPPWQGPSPMFPFVLTGQSIDRKLYDHVNSYTGETGSDGVVRVPAANLNATYVRLDQAAVRKGKKSLEAALTVGKAQRAPRTALAVLPGRSHSGDKMGILRSIKASGRHPTIAAILRCLSVTNAAQYEQVCQELDALTAKTQKDEQVEVHDRILLPDTFTIHDRYSMVIVRLRDDQGHTLDDFDLLILGQGSSPDRLPPGFFVDRQRNKRARNTLTYYLNHDVITGGAAIVYESRALRPSQPVSTELGFRVQPRPTDGFMHYVNAELKANKGTLDEFLRANETLLLDIVLRRVVRSGTFTLTKDRKPADFTNVPPGDPI